MFYQYTFPLALVYAYKFPYYSSLTVLWGHALASFSGLPLPSVFRKEHDWETKTAF